MQIDTCTPFYLITLEVNKIRKNRAQCILSCYFLQVEEGKRGRVGAEKQKEVEERQGSGVGT